MKSQCFTCLILKVKTVAICNTKYSGWQRNLFIPLLEGKNLNIPTKQNPKYTHTPKQTNQPTKQSNKEKNTDKIPRKHKQKPAV